MKGVLVGSLLVFVARAAAESSSDFVCPEGQFRCGNDELCFPQHQQCDKQVHCPKAEDETNCSVSFSPFKADKAGSLETVFSRVPVNTSLYDEIIASYNICGLVFKPARCTCRKTTWLNCKNANLTDFPTVSSNVTSLILINNSLDSISVNSLRFWPHLQLIHLEGNNISSLELGAFSSLKKLKRLFLGRNRLSPLSPLTFDGLSNLEWLNLDSNGLNDDDLRAFFGLTNLTTLDLADNNIQLLHTPFPFMENLIWLDLNKNNLTFLRNTTFVGLRNLEVLNLGYNRIWFIEHGTFAFLTRLVELDLSSNLLMAIEAGIFTGLSALTKLYLDHNHFYTIPSHAFAPLKQLKSLNLEGIDLIHVTITSFAPLPHLEKIYFKYYRLCSFAPRVRVCRPLSDGVSSTENLLATPVLRLIVWFMASFTCLGNTFVLRGRIIGAGEDNRVHSLFIRNLAVADLLMGLYLFVIGIHDLLYRNQYNMHAHKWMSSWRCTVSGTVALTSSEASVLLLTFISFERFLCIVSPYNTRALSVRGAFTSLAVIWGCGGILALTPVFSWQTRERNRFYGTNGMCFPLHIDEPYLLGWEYSVFVFIVVNGCGVVIITFAYIAMFVSIQRTSKASSIARKETEFAIRFSCIVLTDCLCWLPIILLKIIALHRIRVPADVYAWMVVVVLPINSAFNPFLYTFLTPKFRSRIHVTLWIHPFLSWIGNVHRKDSDTDTSSTIAKRVNAVPANHPRTHYCTGANLQDPTVPEVKRDLFLGSIESCI